jgi:hypothetical protein
MCKTTFQNPRDTKTRGEISDQRFKEIGLKPDTLKTYIKHTALSHLRALARARTSGQT